MMRIAISLVAALVLSSCGDDSEMAMDFPPTSKINGEVPPGRMYPLVDVTTMLDTITADGDRLVITRGVRLAGTRVGIHVHEYGGQTCVISGTITDFVEGQEPAVFPEGTCYYMPPNTPMSAANLEDVPAILIDTFKVPPEPQPSRSSNRDGRRSSKKPDSSRRATPRIANLRGLQPTRQHG